MNGRPISERLSPSEADDILLSDVCAICFSNPLHSSKPLLTVSLAIGLQNVIRN